MKLNKIESLFEEKAEEKGTNGRGKAESYKGKLFAKREDL